MVHSSSSAHVIYHGSAILLWPWAQPVLIQTQEMENWFLTRQITGKRSSVLFNQASLMENQPRQSFEHVQKYSILTTQFDIDKISSYQITCSVPRHGHTNKWYFSKKCVLAAQVFTPEQKCIEKISWGLGRQKVLKKWI